MPPVSFRLAIIANNIPWATFSSKVEAIRQFFAPVCDLQIIVEHTQLHPVFKQYPDFSPLSIVDYDWYDQNISTPHALTADIVLFVVTPEDHAGVVTTAGTMTQHNVGPWETTVFAAAENDRLYVNGKDAGDYFTLYACHELAHVFYAMLGKRDDTHAHFPNTPQSPTFFPDDPNPQHCLTDLDFSGVRQTFILGQLTHLLLQAAQALSLIQKKRISGFADQAQTPPPIAPQPSYDWSTPEAARHSLRVICDEEGLTAGQKYIMSKVVHCESGYHPATIHPNLYDGKVVSTDYGICQWNDHYHGTEISPDQAVHDPEKAVRLMCQYVKAGKINQWVCYSSGLYLSYSP
jgi:hypothetical protein